MARTTERGNTRSSHWLLFWCIVLVICGGVGYGSFIVGKDIIGARLAKEGTPIRDLSTSPPERMADAEQPPVTPYDGVRPSSGPPEPVVEIEELEPEEGPAATEESDTETTSAEPEPKQPPADESAEAAESVAPTEPPTEAEPPAELEPSPAHVEPPPSRAEPPREPIVEEHSAGKTYIVRAGSFTTREALDARIRELKSQGYRPWQTTIERDGQTYTRVNVAEFSTADEAAQLQRELAKVNIDADIDEE